MKIRLLLSLPPLVFWLLVCVWHGYWLSPLTLSLGQWSFAISYSVLSLLLLTTAARLRITPYLPVWRMVALIVGLIAVSLELWWRGFDRHVFLTYWSAALIGLAGMSLLVRVLPKRWLDFWLGTGQIQEEKS